MYIYTYIYIYMYIIERERERHIHLARNGRVRRATDASLRRIPPAREACTIGWAADCAAARRRLAGRGAPRARPDLDRVAGCRQVAPRARPERRQRLAAPHLLLPQRKRDLCAPSPEARSARERPARLVSGRPRGRPLADGPGARDLGLEPPELVADKLERDVVGLT